MLPHLFQSVRQASLQCGVGQAFIKLLLISATLISTPLLAEETELEIQTYPAEKSIAQVLWIPSEQGVLPQEQALAKQLAQNGFTVSMPNLFESYFLPIAPSSMRKIPPKVLVAELEKMQQTKQPIFIVSSNEGAALSVKALVAAQQQPKNLVGAVFINPNLYVKTPEAGKAAEYWPETQQINLPIYLIQAELSPWRWHLADLQQRLSQSGSDVFVKLVPKVRDRYYFRPDSLAIENQTAEHLAQDIVDGFKALTPYLAQNRQAGKGLKMAKNDSKTTRPGGSDGQKQAQKQPNKAKKSVTGLQPYTGAQDRPLQLTDLQNKTHDLKDYQGQVVLLNFWASWCPPCVHEIPSMTRLKTQLKDQPFEILAANLAEQQPEIDAFIKEHPVNFPVLLDPKGSAVQAWKVFAYPSTYVIDKKGVIRFALFGGHEWDEAETVKQIQALIDEK